MTDKRQRLMARVARHITCNPPFVVRSLMTTISGALSKILEFPEDPKYRTLRFTNATVQGKILAAHGGRELLHLLGFEKITEQGGGLCYFLTDVDMPYLSEAKDWIQKQCEVALQMEPAQAAEAVVCAEAVVQIRLTTSQTLEGGFSKCEKVKDIYEFVKASVANPEENLLLRGPPGMGDLDEDSLDKNLEAMNMAPRIKLSVVKARLGGMSATEEEIMKESRMAAMRAEQEAAKHLRMVKEHHLRMREEQTKEKERIIQEFREDREKAAAKREHSEEQLGYLEQKGTMR
jgi:hypothetical protein